MAGRGSKTKFKPSTLKSAVSRLAADMAASPSTSQHSSAHKEKLSRKKVQPSASESFLNDFDQPAEIQSDIFQKFEFMLQKALKQTSDHITDKLTREIRELGQRTSELEQRMDDIDNYTEHYGSELATLKEENTALMARLENQENRDRRSNIRVRGIPETVQNLQEIITQLFQELIPDTPLERLEMDRVHRALAPRKPNGPPRDIIAKLHYYKTKEQLLIAARGKDTLSFQGCRLQLFADLSPLTVAKRRALKPLLQVLQRNQIIYRWGFPFSLRFTHLETKYVCRSSEDLKSALTEMGIADDTIIASQSRKKLTPQPHQQTFLSSNVSRSSTQQNLNKRGRYENPSPTQEDSMD